MGKKVLVGGTFNILHPGHVLFLKKAKALGDTLVVVVASDRTVLKEKDLLLFPARKRAGLLRQLGFIDKVVLGSERDRLEVVERERPDIIALGHDQKGAAGLRKELKERGLTCKVVRIKDRLKGWSTRTIRERKRKQG